LRVVAQAPPTQYPDVQSPSFVQLLRQAVFDELQTSELEQEAALGAHLWPLSQAFVVRVEPVHDAAPHVVPTAGARQPLAPSQVPSGPHGALLLVGQAPCGAATPGSTGRHCPSAALPV